MSELDTLLLRQLRKSGLEDPLVPPDPTQWVTFLNRVSEHYRSVKDDRDLLTRSLELSTTEMDELRQRLEADRDRFMALVVTVTEALALFGEVAAARDSDSGRETTGLITRAKRLFTVRLDELFPRSDSDSSTSNVQAVHDSLLSLADKLASLVMETAQGANLRKEIEVARTVQQLLVPSAEPIKRAGLRIAGHYQPAAECGGDLWACSELTDSRSLVVIGDVTGHGVAAAIMTGAAKAACDLARAVSRSKLTAGVVLQMMNVAIHEAAHAQFLMTASAAVFEPQTRTLGISSAGHAAPLLLRDGALQPLQSRGAPLGMNLNGEYLVTKFELQPKDMICWYTDGVTELERPDGEQFSEKRLRAVLAGPPRAPEEVRAALVGALQDFAGGRIPDDDVTFVVAAVE